MVILAEGEGLKRGLGVLEEWHSEWAIKMNSDKCDAMHRRNGVKRTTTIFSVGGERGKVVESCSAV